MKRRYVQSDSTQRHTWDVERIWKLADELEATEIPINDIVGIDDVTWFHENHQPTIRCIAEHAKRIVEADTTFPPILTQDNRVFDGMHRIAQHLMNGKNTIVVKKFRENPEPDLIEKF